VLDAQDLELDFPLATAGDIARINLQSARQQSWNRFWQAPLRAGIAECLVEQEHLIAQFLGDLGAFDRLETLANELVRVDAESIRVHLIRAQVASMAHRFDEAKGYLAQAAASGAPPDSLNRLSLSIDQARGFELDTVLEARRRLAAESGRLEDLVPLGALHADLREFEAAKQIYTQAIQQYQDVSPFALAWACFQMGVLCGELLPDPQPNRAAQWYEKAIDFLPCYVKARVHLAEIYAHNGHTAEAEALLMPALAAGDPEVNWRLADVLHGSGRFADAQAQMMAARAGFKNLLDRHLLAFADHGAEFYSGSGDDAGKALDLARINAANRPTLRALEQAFAIAIKAGEPQVASEILDTARERSGRTAAFRHSPLGAHGSDRATSYEGGAGSDQTSGVPRRSMKNAVNPGVPI
jgi:tetratricopeptide (TPR) repeat protein